MKDGYEEAVKLERTINAKIRSTPITKENAKEYWKFFRTVISGLKILEQEAIKLTREAMDETVN